jgi:hemoglobin
MNDELILEVIQDFYLVAKKDILIGYHFRVIDDFDEHIPKIADFWNLQLNGKMKDRSHLPFDLIGKHRALNINLGEVHRWEMLFVKILENFLDSKKLTQAQVDQWKLEVGKFKQAIIRNIFG